MERRQFVQGALASLGFAASSAFSWPTFSWPPAPNVTSIRPRVYSITPVVGDGKWVWTEPPQGETGYLEPRKFRVSVGIEMEGVQRATQIRATTPIPMELPEQTIEDVRTEASGCETILRRLAPEASQLCLQAAVVEQGQRLRAAAHFEVTLYKQYHGFARDQFPVGQAIGTALRRQYATESPGIQVRKPEVRKLSQRVGGQFDHPWDKAKAFYGWVWENIAPRIQYYTSVSAALRDRVGDCEERAAVFVAFCRAAGIPARLVWVPNHNWAEFYLHDHDGRGHWIPAHTAAYSWFGWTGVHELVLQKGDRIVVPELSRPQRLLADWMRFDGRRPKVRYRAEIEPIAPIEQTDPGPGKRAKDAKGEWLASGSHKLDRSLRGVQ